MAYDPVLVPTPVAGKAVPYTWFTKLRDSIIAVRTLGSVSPDVYSPAVLTASVNDYAIPSTALTVRLGANAAWNITGIVAPPTGPYHFMMWNRSGFAITLKNQNVGSAAANRFWCVGGVDYVLGLGGGVECWYDVASTLWAVR